MELSGTVLITGIGRGFGKALAEKFVRENYQVVGVLRKESQLKDFPAEIGEKIQPVIADISEDGCIQRIRKAIGDLSLDLLINNAGIPGHSAKLSDSRSSDLLDLFNTHCVGTHRVIKAVIGNLLMSEKPEIININSRMGSVSTQFSGIFAHLPTSYEYRIAKAAQNMLSACIKSEYSERIRIYSVHPGRMKTGSANLDADTSPEDAAENLFTAWTNRIFRESAGISDTAGRIYAW